MNVEHLRRWSWLHKWSSLVCTAFLLLLCVTGLPLIFKEELLDWLGAAPVASAANAPLLPFGRLVETSRRLYPGQAVISVVPDDLPAVRIYMAPSFRDWHDHPQSRHSINFDGHTGQVLAISERPHGRGEQLLVLVRRLHTDLCSGLGGGLFLGAMALLFVVAIVSGIMLYRPFTQKLAFGAVRERRSRRVRWLDRHNLLAVATLSWALVVGLTGALNEVAVPLFGIWQGTDVQGLLAPWKGRPPPRNADWVASERVFDTVRRAMPDMHIVSIAFPDAIDGSPYHYMVWTKGGAAWRSRLYVPVLVDARSGAITAAIGMPWYLRALELSRPLHFGDYAGLPLKMLWVLLDLLTIVVLGSGLYLWAARRASATSTPTSAPTAEARR